MKGKKHTNNKHTNNDIIDTIIIAIGIILLCILITITNTKAAINEDVWHEEIRQPVFTQDLKPTPIPTPKPKPLNEQAVDTAKSYIGVPYVWGGTTPNGFDCSGLMQYVYKKIGVNISRTTSTQINDGRAVSKDELKQGDLILFGSPVHHVGMYIGNGQFIHAPQTGETVKISNLSDRNDYACARRIVE